MMSVFVASSLTTSCFSHSPGSTAETLYRTGAVCRAKALSGHERQQCNRDKISWAECSHH